jgi:uroporphyrinogen-III synthase
VNEPLAGRVVLVTRPADQSEDLVRALRHRGAVPIIAPTIELIPVRSGALSRAMRDLAAGDFAWVTLTSRATVDVLRERLSSPRDVKASVAAVGEGTAAAFRRWARRDPDLTPGRYTTAALARALPRGSGRVLCARADIAPSGLEDAIAAKGWSPTRVDAYRIRISRSLPAEARDALRDGRLDAVTFTSASTVRGFARGLIGPPATHVAGRPKVVCIGPVTSREARALGFPVHAVAKPHTMEGLVTALERVFTPRTRGRPRSAGLGAARGAR